jgi:hypothetical protein
MKRRKFLTGAALTVGALALKRIPAAIALPARPLVVQTPIMWSYLNGDGDQSKVSIQQDGTLVCSVGQTLSYISSPVSGDFSVIFEAECAKIGYLGFTPEVITGEDKDATGIFIDQGLMSPGADTVNAEGLTGLRRARTSKQKFEIRVTNHQVNYYIDDAFWCKSEQTAQVKPLQNTVRIVAGFNNVYKEMQAFLRPRIVK